MRILLAFDKFKHALSADAACAAAACGLAPNATCDACPLTDGGEGFATLLTRAAGGELHSATVTGPRGAPVVAAFGFVRWARIPAAARALLPRPPAGDAATVAVVELAAASGVALLAPAERDPWAATTRGTGELLRAAAARGAGLILLGLGGSATHDLGLGALAALGWVPCGRDGRTLDPAPRAWPELHHFTGRVADLPPLRIACDVTNPLLGPQGAATVFGPQKGLRAADLPRLEAATARVSALLCAHADRPPASRAAPGAGAAGGTAFGLACAAGAQLVPGADLVAAWLELDARLAAADLVLTGEGCFDDSSLTGKGPGAVVRRALALGKAVHVFAGRLAVTSPPPAGLHLHAITPPGTDLAVALPATAENLTAAVRRLGAPSVGAG